MSRNTLATEPGLWQSIWGVLFGRRRQFDCLQVEVSSRCMGRCGYCPHTTLQNTGDRLT